jgi:VanZ family protein
MVLLYLMSAQNSFGAPIRVWDKLLHVGAYAGLGFLSIRAFHGGLGWLGLRPTLMAVATTMAYGAVDELHQARVPGRVASVADWGADAIGTVLAVLIVGAAVGIRSALPGKDAIKPAGCHSTEERR